MTTPGLFLEVQQGQFTSTLYARLVRRMNDGCSPHILADWRAVKSMSHAKDIAFLEGATIERMPN
jgi:hypothetical protein